MADDIKPDVIRRTQDILGKLIKKPQLSEKLLRKPPFRFLHDIITNIIKETGFLQGLFTEEELNHENIKDRDGKIAFLDKLINCVKLATGASLNVRSTKIVAGLEPTRTNELLQAIGLGVNSKTDTSKAVQDILKKSLKKGSVNEVKKKEKPSDAPKHDTSKREKRDSIGETKKSDKKDSTSSGKGLLKVSDKKTEKQEDASDSKKKLASTGKATKDSQKVTIKPGTTTKVKREDSGDKPIEKKSEEPRFKEELKDEPKFKDEPKLIDEPKPEERKAKEEPGNEPKDESTLQSEMLFVSNEPSKDNEIQEENLETTIFQNKESTGVPLPKAAASEQDQENNQGKSSPKKPPQVPKESTERQRPISALGRKRSFATNQLKHQSTVDEPIEPTEFPVLTNNSDFKVAKIEKEKQDTSSTVSQIPPNRPPSSIAGPSRASSDNQSVSGAAPIPLVRPRTAARVGSARPGAPRLRNRGEVALVSEEQVKPSTVNLIVEADGIKEDQDEDENLVILETATTNAVIDSNIPRPGSEVMRPPSQQGQLVAQILETQKELEGSKLAGQNSTQIENSSHKVEINWEASRQRERGTAVKEVQRLCESIQTVTRAAHPIGKLLDSLQEDIDSMQQELEQWQNVQRTLEEQLLAEEALTVQSTQPLKEHLQQLQQAVLAQQDQLSASKASILANDQRIHKLLAGGDSSKQAVFSV